MNVRRACAVMAVWQLCACGRIVGIEELREGAPDAAPVRYAVTGTAVGLLEPVTARLEHAGGIELMRIEEDGAFEFAAALAEGDLYSVTLMDEPPCVLEDASGQVEGAIPPVSLACESVLLDALALSGATAPELDFAAAQHAYEAEVSLLQQFVHVTATAASEDATLTVNGTPVASGAPSEPIALALGDNHIEITVTNARGAQRVYVVNVARAGKIAQYVYAKASDSMATYRFGHAIALWGDTLAVSTACCSGTNPPTLPTDYVYIFRRFGSAWIQEAQLGRGGGFGRSLALWEDTLAIGAPLTSDIIGNRQNFGSVSVYRRSGDTWLEDGAVLVFPRESYDNFGTQVALWGDTLAISATGEDSAATGINGDRENNDAPNSGAVYVFRRGEASWELESYIKPSNSEAEDGFGSAIAVWQDTLVVGAPGEDSATRGINGDELDNGASNSGAVYVFRRFDDAWVQESYLKASNVDAADAFGTSLALWNETLAVGTPSEDSRSAGMDGDQMDNSLAGSGAVYIFQRTGLDWTQEALIKASNADAGDFFGQSVTLWGDTLAVGTKGEDSAATGVDGDQQDASAPNSGAIYLFHRTGSTWTQSTYAKASNPEEQDVFGSSVALWEQQLVASAPFESSAATGIDGDQSDNSANDSGAVYIFH